MNEKNNTNFMMTMAFSLFGMLLIFGLGFVFPSINPYMVIKWIIIVCGIVFVYAVLYNFVSEFRMNWKKSYDLPKLLKKVNAKKTK